MPSERKPTIEQIEAELRESQFKAWDAEEFLANRHRAKIEALSEVPQKTWRHRWSVAKQVAWELMALFGYVSLSTLVGIWLIAGEFPIHAHTAAEQAAIDSVNLIPPPLGPARD